MKKICVVTGTRAEYGLLRPVIKRIEEDKDLELVLVATGMHLSPEFGLTYKEIEKDGFRIAARNEMLLSADTPSSIAKSIGLGIIGFADILSDCNLDLVVLLGDRFEMLAAASVALVNRIPIAHIHGGELTEGAIDDAIRHSLTKMSSLHFVSTEEYRKRVIQMGEQPKNVFCVGSLGVESIKNLQLLKKAELEKIIDYHFNKTTILVTFHPVTLEQNTSEMQMKELLDALNDFEVNIIFTKANADTDGRIINQMIDEYVDDHKENSAAYTSLGQLNYLSALQYCTAVVGNSSSGILEAPSFGIPTVNIGKRQKGRIMTESVICCGSTKKEICQALKKALSTEFSKRCQFSINPYEKEDTSKNIISEIKEYLSSNTDIEKEFYNIDFL